MGAADAAWNAVGAHRSAGARARVEQRLAAAREALGEAAAAAVWEAGRALLTEVIPEVEKLYRVSRDRNSRAITGLSMGGTESLLVGLNALNRFAWVGAFSSGGLNEELNTVFPALDAKANAQLRLLWIACGTEDRLIDTSRKLREWLKSKGVQHTGIETPGAHTWMVWRRNLADFAPLLFQDKAS